MSGGLVYVSHKKLFYGNRSIISSELFIRSKVLGTLLQETEWGIQDVLEIEMARMRSKKAEGEISWRAPSRSRF